jgi:hypothetical protein
LTGAAELEDDESDDDSATEATDLGLGSLLILDAPSEEEETEETAETAAAEESAEEVVVEVLVLTIGLIILILAVSF